jgi:hypothetical protein
MYQKIIDHQNLVRDSESGAVLNIDRKAKEGFLKAREEKRRDKARLSTLENDVSNLHMKLDVILELLKNK